MVLVIVIATSFMYALTRPLHDVSTLKVNRVNGTDDFYEFDLEFSAVNSNVVDVSISSLNLDVFVFLGIY